VEGEKGEENERRANIIPQTTITRDDQKRYLPLFASRKLSAQFDSLTGVSEDMMMRGEGRKWGETDDVSHDDDDYLVLPFVQNVIAEHDCLSSTYSMLMHVRRNTIHRANNHCR
jgi:hypothetical protein